MQPMDFEEPTSVIEPDDRRKLAKIQTGKTTKWPRTNRRQQRIRQVLERRQPDFTVVLENVHDPHNVSAVLRSCDAVGILAVHTIYSVEAPPERVYARTTSGSAAKWIDIHQHDSVESCFTELRTQGFTILATALTGNSVYLTDVDLTQPVALVFGNEMRGVTAETVDAADGSIKIPMQGMIESLNISVACAVCLFEAMRQRKLVGAYDTPKLSVEQLDALAKRWLDR
jgi:tRNA (guanosine-2'-O-)-methyltransferase